MFISGGAAGNLTGTTTLQTIVGGSVLELEYLDLEIESLGAGTTRIEFTKNGTPIFAGVVGSQSISFDHPVLFGGGDVLAIVAGGSASVLTYAYGGNVVG